MVSVDRIFDDGEMTIPFARALEERDLTAIQRAPKAEFHRHHYFGTRIENVERWLGRPLERPVVPMRGLKGMLDYAGSALDPYLRSREACEFIARAAVEEAIEDGVRQLEMSFDVRSASHFETGVEGFALTIRDLIERHRERIDLRPELGIPREIIGDGEMAHRAREGIDSGVFRSIDVYGDEHACALDAVIPIYEHARSAGMKLKAHAGEFGGAERVRETSEALGLDEIQHGIAAAESADVMRWLSDNRIRLHVCPSSNVMLGAVDSLSTHPIRALFDHGIEVTVNTDDPMIFGQSVSQEYLNLFEAGVFSAEELDGIRIASMQS